MGACLVHVIDDNGEKPIAYALRTLTKSEMAYAQIERQGLTLVFGVCQFHLQYLHIWSINHIGDRSSSSL